MFRVSRKVVLHRLYHYLIKKNLADHVLTFEIKQYKHQFACEIIY